MLGLSSLFSSSVRVVVVHVIRPNDALLVVGGARHLQAAIAVSIECGSGGLVVCVLGGPSSLVGGSGGRSSSGGLSWVVGGRSVVV